MKPETKEAINNYMTWGHPPGDFIQSVLANDLGRAFDTGDGENIADLREILQYLNKACPRAARGTYAQTRAWIRGGGSAGRRKHIA